MEKQKLIGKTLSELQEICQKNSIPKYTAKQISDWLYKKRVKHIGDMTNISKTNRDILNENYIIGYTNYKTLSKSKDGTIKYLFPTTTNNFIETVYIPQKTRNTLCVSSQAGCKMNCKFCSTGKQGFQSNLSSNEIINQILNFPESNSLTNIVYMGMGEPMDNLTEVIKSIEILTSEYGFGWSPKRITVSTIGLIPDMIRFIEETKCHLAISMHNPFDDERAQIMPIQNKYPINEIITVLKNYDFSHQRRVSFEYIMFKNFNDTDAHINKLTKLLHGLSCRINLIKYHQIPESKLIGSDDATIKQFESKLNAKGITTTIRASRGQDIEAACGLLSTKEMLKK